MWTSAIEGRSPTDCNSENKNGKSEISVGLDPKWRVSSIALSRKTEIDNCTTTFSMSVGVLLSTRAIGLPGQAWPSLANAHLAEFIHFFSQVQLSHTRISVLDLVYPTWQ